MKVYNKSTLLVEKATKKTCPRCSGFGGLFHDDKNCHLCNGYGKLWVSVNKTGWVRAFRAKIENSQLY